jgi:hypothetical protein
VSECEHARTPRHHAYLCALEARIAGRTLESVRVASAFVLRTAQPPIAEAQGQAVRELRRIGKRVAIGMSNDLWIVIHLMIAGRLHWRAPGVKLSLRAGRIMFAGSQFIRLCHDAIASICQDFPTVRRGYVCRVVFFGLMPVRRDSEKALYTAADGVSRIWHDSQGKGFHGPKG